MEKPCNLYPPKPAPALAFPDWHRTRQKKVLKPYLKLLTNEIRQQMSRRIFLITSTASISTGPRDENSSDHAMGLPVRLSLRRESVQNGHRGIASDKNIIHISWQTNAEVDTLHFELQRSVNGKHYHTVETIMAMGNSRSTSRYRTTDNGFIFYGLYYRLKLVFTNGREIFTEPVVLKLNSVAGATVHDLTYNRNNQ